MEGARKIRSEKLREHQYREEYTRSLEGKRVNEMEETILSTCGSRCNVQWSKVQENV